MKIFKGIIAFLLFVFCLGFLAGLSNKNNIDWGSLFPSKETETITDEVNETSASQDLEALTSDLQESTSEPQESMTEVFPDEVDFSKLSINFLGDSITAGCGNYAPTYVPTVQEILNFLNFNNYGVGGSTIADVSDYSFIDRYPSMTNNADIILVFGGINDASSGVEMGNIDDTNSGTFYGALNTLVLGLQKKYPSSYIFLVTPYMLYSPDHYQMWDETLKLPSGYTRYDYNVAIKAIGEKYGIDVLDLWDLNTDESCFVDGVHPTVDFCSNTLAPTIAQFIKDNYKKPN